MQPHFEGGGCIVSESSLGFCGSINRNRDRQSPTLHPSYRATVKRSPQAAPLFFPTTLSEETGLVFSQGSLGLLDDDPLYNRASTPGPRTATSPSRSASIRCRTSAHREGCSASSRSSPLCATSSFHLRAGVPSSPPAFIGSKRSANGGRSRALRPGASGHRRLPPRPVYVTTPFQLCSRPWGGGIFFEVVERRGGDAGYGAPNALFRIAAQKRLMRPKGMPRTRGVA